MGSWFNRGFGSWWIGAISSAFDHQGRRIGRGLDNSGVPPTATSAEGTAIPFLIGRERLSYTCGWVGSRSWFHTHTGSAGKGHAHNPPGPLSYTEGAWHQLCVGPAKTLHRIWQDDLVIFEGPVSSEDTPSGTALLTVNGEEFAIYWGELDQPVDDYLADASRVGIPSNWPYLCYIRWTNKFLGTSPHWGRLEYDLETEPQIDLCGPRTRFYGDDVPGDTFAMSVGISISSGPFAGTIHLQEDTTDATHLGTVDNEVVPATGTYRCYENGDPDADNSLTFGVQHGAYDAGELTTAAYKIRDGAGEQVFFDQGGTVGHVVDPPEVDCEEYFAAGDTPTYPSFDVVVRHGLSEIVVDLQAGPIDMWLEGTIVADTGAQPFRPIAGSYFYFQRITNVRSGPAPMTALAQILFAPSPHGLGLSQDQFDMDSFTEVDAVLHAEGVVVSLVAANGDEAATLLEKMLSELGIFMVLNPTTGLYQLRAQRSGQTPKVVPLGMVTESPEVVGTRGERAATRLIYTFKDKTDSFAEKTITVDADGAQTILARSKPKEIKLETISDLGSASSIAQRDAQRELAGNDKVDLLLNRSGQLLLPGDRLDVSSKGFEEFLRVVSIERKPDGKCQVSCSPDHYGAPVVVFAPPTSGGGSSSGAPPVADLQSEILEIPAYLLVGGGPTIVVPRIRATTQTTKADHYLSGDDTTYHFAGSEFSIQTGGTLIDPIDAADPWVTDGDYTFTLLGPDATEIQDYTSDEPSWLSGRQVCVIDEEIFFLRNVTALGGGVYSLNGLLRARYDTDPASHAAGAKVFIFDFNEVLLIQDPLVQPGQTLYAKTQPWTYKGLDLGSITAINKVLHGKGLVPMNPTALRVTAPRLGVPGYFTGEDLQFSWDYRSTDAPTNGAGMQPAGQAVADSDIEGFFELKVYDAGNVLVRTENVATPVYLYTNAVLQADLGGETDFRVEVRQVNNGFKSDSIELSIVSL